MREYNEYIEDRMDGMIDILESCNTIAMEGLLQKWKEKRQIRRERRHERYVNGLLSSLLVVQNGDSLDDEFENILEKFMTDLQKEIPGIIFNNRLVNHSISDLTPEYDLHEFRIHLCTLKGYNLDSFIRNTDNKALKMKYNANNAAKTAKIAKHVYDKYNKKDEEEYDKVDATIDIVDATTEDLDKLIDIDVRTRIFSKLSGLGFINVHDTLILYKEGKKFITLKYISGMLILEMSYITKG